MTQPHLKSYLSHADHYEKDLTDPERLKIGRSWFREDTANYWVHERLFEGAVHLLQGGREKTWVTVGDGRYGLDSIILKRKGWRHVVPTDISGHLLKKAQEEGLISEYKVENAESLSFSSSSFDYVFCKESYHHFPRPMIALYEMLRVAREGVLLIEPWDTVQGMSLHAFLRRIKRGIKKKLSHFFLRLKARKSPHLQEDLATLDRSLHIDAGRYEDSGNYIYGITDRELEKVALGLNYPLVAFKGMNDSYEAGCEFEIASFKNPFYRRMRFKGWRNDFLCWLGFKNYSMLMAVLFKVNPSPEVRAHLEKAGWRLIFLPSNPYA